VNVNQLVDVLAGVIAAGHGDAEVLIGMARVGEIAGSSADALLSGHNWTVSHVTDETRDRFVLLQVEVTD